MCRRRPIKGGESPFDPLCVIGPTKFDSEHDGEGAISRIKIERQCVLKLPQVDRTEVERPLVKLAVGAL